MTREEIKNKVAAIVADKMGFPVNGIKESTSFKYDLGTDSLDDVEIVMELEREFGIKIPDGDMMRVVTVGDANDVICQKLDVPICKQQPEANLEEEVKRWKDEHGVVGMDVLWLDLARHFYELGLKGRKEE